MLLGQPGSEGHDDCEKKHIVSGYNSTFGATIRPKIKSVLKSCVGVCSPAARFWHRQCLNRQDWTSGFAHGFSRNERPWSERNTTQFEDSGGIIRRAV